MCRLAGKVPSAAGTSTRTREMSLTGLNLPPWLFYATGYVFLLIALLVVVNMALNRRLREERNTAADRRRRAREAQAHSRLDEEGK